jgi:hypothetical protein
MRSKRNVRFGGEGYGVLQDFTIKIEPVEVNDLERSAFCTTFLSAFDQFSRYAARNAQNIDRFTLGNACFEKTVQLVTSVEEAGTEGLDSTHSKKLRVQPMSNPKSAGWSIAINMIREPVAAGILESLARQVGGAQEPIKGKLQHATAPQQFRANRRRTPRAVVEVWHEFALQLVLESEIQEQRLTARFAALAARINCVPCYESFLHRGFYTRS